MVPLPRGPCFSGRLQLHIALVDAHKWQSCWRDRPLGCMVLWALSRPLDLSNNIQGVADRLIHCAICQQALGCAISSVRITCKQMTSALEWTHHPLLTGAQVTVCALDCRSLPCLRPTFSPTLPTAGRGPRRQRSRRQPGLPTRTTSSARCPWAMRPLWAKKVRAPHVHGMATPIASCLSTIS